MVENKGGLVWFLLPLFLTIRRGILTLLFDLAESGVHIFLLRSLLGKATIVLYLTRTWLQSHSTKEEALTKRSRLQLPWTLTRYFVKNIYTTFSLKNDKDINLK